MSGFRFRPECVLEGALPDGALRFGLTNRGRVLAAHKRSIAVVYYAFCASWSDGVVLVAVEAQKKVVVRSMRFTRKKSKSSCGMMRRVIHAVIHAVIYMRSYYLYMQKNVVRSMRFTLKTSILVSLI